MSGSEFERWFDHTKAIDLSVEEIDAPRLPETQELLAFYASLGREEALPTRSEIDPLTIPRPLLTSVYLLEPNELGNDWIYRLVGSSIVDRFRTDRTGQSLRSFLPPNTANDFVVRSNSIAKSRKPAVFRLFSVGTAMDNFYAETLSLPVLDPKSGHIWIFGGTFFGNAVRP